jgi:ABC-2 type transport system permease protein
LGRIAALASVGAMAGLFYFGWEFTVQDFPRGGNPLGALVLLAVYMPAVACLGCLLGVWFADRERSMQVLLLTSLPMAFVSGFSWPSEALPWPLHGLRWLIPSTSGIQASLRLNQMGAPLGDVAGPLTVLLALALGLGALLLWWARPRGAGVRPAL